MTLSCLGPAATQFQSQQAAGLKDKLVGDTLGRACDKYICEEPEIAGSLGFLSEGT